ncbi:MAG: hypothetical protein ACJA2F_000698, partial [Nitriliruptoraceae bacterium]
MGAEGFGFGFGFGKGECGATGVGHDFVAEGRGPARDPGAGLELDG